MQKEALTLDAIKKDLKLIIDGQYSNKSERWIFAMLYLPMATVGIGVLFKGVHETLVVDESIALL